MNGNPRSGGRASRAGRGARRGRPPGPSRGAEERRAELLDAATEAIARHGSEASMAEIAEAAGITKPILYRHFGDKAGLAGALAERAVQALNESLADRLSAAVSPRLRMREAIAAFVAFTHEQAALYRFLVRGATEAGRHDLVDGIARQIAVVLGTGLRRAGADSGPAELWAHAIIGAVFSGSQWWQERPVVSEDQLVDDLTRLLWDGLASTGLDGAGADGG